MGRFAQIKIDSKAKVFLTKNCSSKVFFVLSANENWPRYSQIIPGLVSAFWVKGGKISLGRFFQIKSYKGGQ